MKVIVTRPRDAGRAARRAARGARTRGRRMPADRDRADVGPPDRRRRLRLGRRHEPERRGRDRAARARTCRRSPPSGPAPPSALREHGLEPSFVPRVSTQEGLLAEFPRPAGRVLFAAAESSRRGPIDALDADFVPLYATRLLDAGAAGGGRRPARLRLRGARVCGDRRRQTRGLHRAADDPRRAKAWACRSPPKRGRTTWTGSSQPWTL